MSPWKTETN